MAKKHQGDDHAYQVSSVELEFPKKPPKPIPLKASPGGMINGLKPCPKCQAYVFPVRAADGEYLIACSTSCCDVISMQTRREDHARERWNSKT